MGNDPVESERLTVERIVGAIVDENVLKKRDRYRVVITLGARAL